MPEPAQTYSELRNRILTLPPHEAGIVQSAGIPNVWGVLMETGYPEAVVSLVALADGTTSLYFGTGGGIIGGGKFSAVADASRGLVSRSEHYLQRMTPTTSFPLPSIERVRFHVLTFSGAFTADGDEKELGDGRHALSPLFYSAHEVITQLRLHCEGEK